MRQLLILVPILAILAGCGTPPPFSARDLNEVHRAYAELVPDYANFKAAFAAKNGVEVMAAYRREQTICHLVDRIDQRDTIDPNVDLFQASANLDSICNDIESVYAYWAKTHGYPYDKTLLPGTLAGAFNDADTNVKDTRVFLRHPAALT